MRIKEIIVGKVSIPVKRPFKTALRQVTSAEDIVVKVIANSGEIGFGSAPPTALITGDTHGSIVAAIRNYISPRLIGMDVENIEEICKLIETSVVHNTGAKSAVEIAVHDLFAQQYRIPLAKLLGGSKTPLSTDLTISVNSPAEMVTDALAAVEEGFTELKIKVGLSPLLDIERIRAIREAVGPNIVLRIDANQGWTAKEAVRCIRQFEDLGLAIDLVEQPVPAHDFAGLKHVTDNVSTLVMADESAFGPREVFELLSMRACDIINIKLAKTGGFKNAARVAALAETMNVQCMMGCMLESKIGVTAAACFASSRSIITRIDLDAANLLAADPVVGGVSFIRNEIHLPQAPGLGITQVQGWEAIP